MKGPYDDIIDLPHHRSKTHPPMPVADRAAQFAPFAALTGYEDMIKEAARLTDTAPSLTEEERERLDRKLQALLAGAGPVSGVTVTWFVPDEKKIGGSYQEAAGTVTKIDMMRKTLVFAPEDDPVPVTIPLAQIVALGGAAADPAAD